MRHIFYFPHMECEESLRVLILSHLYPNTMNSVRGIFVHEQVQELIRQGCEVRVVSPVPWSPIPLSWLLDNYRSLARIPHKALWYGVEVRYPRYRLFPRGYFFEYSGWLYYLGVRKAVKEIHREFSFDIIHAHIALPDGYGAFLLSKAYGKPFVVTIHGHDIRTTIHRNERCRRSILKVFEAASKVICVSTRLKNQCLQAYGRDGNKFEVVNNGVSPAKVFEGVNPLREKYRGKRILLTVGNLVKRKAHDYVIQALSKILETNPQVVYLIVGGGPEETALRQLVGSLGLDEHVGFCGQQENEVAMQYMALCDVFVMPSWNEPFGVVYLEAMASGKPVVACQGQGIEDVVVDGQTGLLVEPKDVKSLQAALLKLLSDREFAENMGERGKQMVLANFTWEKNAKKAMRIYEKVLESEHKASLYLEEKGSP